MPAEVARRMASLRISERVGARPKVLMANFGSTETGRVGMRRVDAMVVILIDDGARL